MPLHLWKNEFKLNGHGFPEAEFLVRGEHGETFSFPFLSGRVVKPQVVKCNKNFDGQVYFLQDQESLEIV